ncbi:MAG: carbonate dehydratase [bacterium]|nr:carbonate dehydratase [bacterium]
MKTLKKLIHGNRAWAENVKSQDPEFFQKLSKQQSPEYLWIGCSDSRVPANQIVGLPPGEIFVHRNVANIVVHTDFNCLSVIQYAVAVLKVRHIIVCGHYGCGGVQAALGNSQLGLIDNWLRHIKDVFRKHEKSLSKILDDRVRLNRLCELNVIEQVNNICHTTMIQEAWRSGQELSVHGWIYGINNGLIKDLNVCIAKQEEIGEIYRMATQQGND